MSYNIAPVNKNKKMNTSLWMVTFIIVIFVLANVNIFQSKEKYRFTKGLNNKIIVLDAGHGGADPGTEFGQLKEKDINMAVVRKLEKEFRNNNVKVFLTREENQGIVGEEKMSLSELDDNLQRRKALAEDEAASLFVSVHVNSSPSSKASGATIYYQNSSQYHYKLAKNIQDELNKLYPKKWSQKEANFVVVRNHKIPSVLVEIGFITNPKDRNFLSTSKGQDLIAKGIFQGVKKYAEELGQSR